MSDSHVERRVVVDHASCRGFRYWVETDRKTALRILSLMEECVRDPFRGTGKPEALRQLPGAWSRRINEYDRLVYMVKEDEVVFLQCRYHYGK